MAEAAQRRLLEQMAAVVEGMLDGLSSEEAATLAELDSGRLGIWLDLGADGHEPFAAFSQAVRAAAVQAKREALRNLRALSVVESRAAELFLKHSSGTRRLPEGEAKRSWEPARIEAGSDHFADWAIARGEGGQALTAESLRRQLETVKPEPSGVVLAQFEPTKRRGR